MTAPASSDSKLEIRACQYRDLEALETLAAKTCEAEPNTCSVALNQHLQTTRRWYGLFKLLSWFPNPYQYYFCGYVAEENQQVVSLIQVSPFNSTRSTWRVDRVITNADLKVQLSNLNDIGSQLLRHCFETIVEARTWLLEVNINHKRTLALYRQNGFQPLAQLTDWAIAPELLEQLAQREPNLPNLLPVSNADAKLLYQLDTVSMPPLLRQVFDRHINDFKQNPFSTLLTQVQHWLGNTETVSSYVFEPQRKAAIGYFKLRVCKDGTRPHRATLTVHPAYTWLYPELLAQMAQIVQNYPPQSLQLASADYQPEREEYLENLGARRIEHTLLMSRSVWHKIRETKPLEALQLSEVLQGLQPRAPIPTRMSFKSLKAIRSAHSTNTAHAENGRSRDESSPHPPEAQT
jgi:ribosomal protein S18 acetylase RimI-like enzyme